MTDMSSLQFNPMDMDFSVHIVKNFDPDCLVVHFSGHPDSFDRIKQATGRLGNDGKRHNMILDFSKIDISVEYLRFFFDQLKHTLDQHALEWCSVSPPSAQNYIPKGLHYVMKNEKPVFSSVDEAKNWILEKGYK